MNSKIKLLFLCVLLVVFHYAFSATLPSSLEILEQRREELLQTQKEALKQYHAAKEELKKVEAAIKRDETSKIEDRDIARAWFSAVVDFDKEKITKLIRKHGEKIIHLGNTVHGDGWLRTALHYVVEGKTDIDPKIISQIFSLLLDYGASVNMPTSSGRTVLDTAVLHGRICLIERLCENASQATMDRAITVAKHCKIDQSYTDNKDQVSLYDAMVTKLSEIRRRKFGCWTKFANTSKTVLKYTAIGLMGAGIFYYTAFCL